MTIFNRAPMAVALRPVGLAGLCRRLLGLSLLFCLATCRAANLPMPPGTQLSELECVEPADAESLAFLKAFCAQDRDTVHRLVTANPQRLTAEWHLQVNGLSASHGRFVGNAFLIAVFFQPDRDWWQWLLTEGFTPDSRGGFRFHGWYSAMEWAIDTDDRELAGWLLAAGADPNAANQAGFSRLLQCLDGYVYQGNPARWALARMFLEHGADPHQGYRSQDLAIAVLQEMARQNQFRTPTDPEEAAVARILYDASAKLPGWLELLLILLLTAGVSAPLRMWWRRRRRSAEAIEVQIAEQTAAYIARPEQAPAFRPDAAKYVTADEAERHVRRLVRYRAVRWWATLPVAVGLLALVFASYDPLLDAGDPFNSLVACAWFIGLVYLATWFPAPEIQTVTWASLATGAWLWATPLTMEGGYQLVDTLQAVFLPVGLWIGGIFFLGLGALAGWLSFQAALATWFQWRVSWRAFWNRRAPKGPNLDTTGVDVAGDWDQAKPGKE